MARQEFQQPQRRRQTKDDSYEDDQGWRPGTSAPNGVSEDAGNALDDIDAALAGQENLPGSGTSGESSNAPVDAGGLRARENGRGAASAAAESSGASADSGGLAPTLQESAGSKDTPGKRGRGPKWWTNRTTRQKSIAGGLVGLTLGATSIFGFSVATGPFQPINYGHILGKPQTNQANAADDRIGKIFRFAKTGEVGQTRLGRIGSFYHKQAQKGFADQGVSFKTDRLTGQIDAVTIDLSKNGRYGNQSAEDALKAFKADNPGATGFQQNGDRISANISKLSSTAKRDIVSSYISDQKVGTTSTYMRLHSEGLFYNARSWFSPIQKGAAEADNQASKALQQKQADDEEQTRAKAVVEKSTPIRDFNEQIRKKVGSKNLKTAGGVLIATQALCVAREVATAIPVINRYNVVVPMVQSAGDATSIAYQVEFGHQLDQAKVGAIVNNFKSTDSKGKTTTPWQSQAIQKLMNPASTAGIPVDAELGSALSPDSNATSIVQAVDKFGAAQLCGTWGQVAQGVAGGLLLLTGTGTVIEQAIHAGIGVGVGVAINAFTQNLTNVLSDDPLTGIPHHGATGGAADGIGAIGMAQSNAMQAGGAAMSGADSDKLSAADDATDRASFARMGVMGRLFNVHDYRSLASTIIDSQDTNALTNTASVFSDALTSGVHLGSIFSHLSSLVTPKASAATTDNSNGWFNMGYNIKEYGFTASELANPLVADPYKNADAVAQLVGAPGSSSYSSYDDRIHKCFGDNFSQDTDGELSIKTDTSNIGGPNPQSDDYANGNCDDTSDSWLQIRFFIFDLKSGEGAACYEGDTESCQDLGINPNPDQTNAEALNFTVGTYNMCQETNHDCPHTGDKTTLISNFITSNNMDIVGAQELSQPTQAGVLAKLPGYASFPATVPPDQGRAILYNTTKFTETGSGSLSGVYSNDGTFITSDTSPYAFPWVKLEGSGHSIVVISSHSPNSGHADPDGMKRKANAEALLTWAQQQAAAGNTVVVTGDFNNSGINLGKDKSPYCVLTADGTLQHAHDMQDGNPVGTACPTPTPDHYAPLDSIYASVNNPITASGWTWMGEKSVNADQTGTDHSPSYVSFALGSTGGGGQYKVGTFNVRGEIHVNSPSTSDASSRMQKAADSIKAANYDIVGLQELEGNFGQYKAFVNDIKDSYDIWPTAGMPDNNHSTENSIIWDKSKFTLVAKGTTMAQYFGGSPLAMPYVELRDNSTSQQFYISNTHDPADGDHGKNAQYREANVAVHLQDAQKWTSGGLPVIMTGDYNWGYNIRKGGPDNDFYYIGNDNSRLPYCLMTKSGILFDVKDVSEGKSGPCPSDTKQINGPYARVVDHLFVSAGLSATGYSTYTNATINSVTDHPGIVTATVTIPGTDSSSSSPGGKDSIPDTYGPACNGRGGPTYGVECSGQCVDYVEYMLDKKDGAIHKYTGFGTGSAMADGLISRYHYKRDDSPQVGDVVSWPNGGVPGTHGQADSGAGHVAVVIAVHGNGDIVVAEYNYLNNGPVNVSGHSFDTDTVPAVVANNKSMTYAHTGLTF